MNIPSLTGARFFAAAAIVLTHSQVAPLFPEGSFWPFDLAGRSRSFSRFRALSYRSTQEGLHSVNS